MATYYWRGGSGTWDSSSTANWSNVSGGAGGFGPPTSSDDVVFNSASSGASYVVTCGSGGNAALCFNITTTAPLAGTLTFEGNSDIFKPYGTTVNIHAACLFSSTVGADQYVRIQHQNFGTTPVTITFNSSGTNTQKVYYDGSFSPNVTFCNAQTCTFASVNILGSSAGTFTCTSSNITVANPVTSFGFGDYFYIRYFENVTVTSTTINFGNAVPISPATAVLFLAANTNFTGGSSCNVNHIRAYDNFDITASGSTAASNQLNNVTLRSKPSPGTQTVYISNINGTFTLWDGSVTIPNFGPITFTGAVALNAGSLQFTNADSVVFNSTVTTTTVGSTSTNTPSINLSTATYITSMTFNGAVLFTGAGCNHILNQGGPSPGIAFNSTLTATITAGNIGYLNFWNQNYGGSQTVNCASTTSLTNMVVNGSAWYQTGASTLTTNSNPTSNTSTFNVRSLSMGTGAASFTSTNVILQDVIPATSTSLNSSALVTVNGSFTTAGVTFSASNAVSFPAATLATWTDVSLSLSGTFTVTGAGGFTLAGTTKNSSISGPFSRISVTGPLTLSAGPLGPPTGIQIESVAASSTLTVNGFGLNASYSTTGNFLNNNTVTGAASFTNINLSNSSGSTSTTFNSTFNWTSALANANTISANGTFNFVGAAAIANPSTLVFYGDIVCNANFAISATSLIDNKSAGATVALTNFTSTNAASTTTFTNARVAISTASIAGAVTLATNGGMYIYGGTATINGALTSSGAGTFFPVEGEGGTTLVLNGAVTLVNANLKVPTITVAGGATKNFAYSLSTPIPDNRGTDGYGTVFYNYPEIAFDTFTLTNTGGTFSIAGGGAVNLRTFISPYSYTTATSAAMNLAVNPTFTDVDFWRVVPGGASTKPWTGTRLGNVGTLTNITTDAPKNTWWVGGGGSWGDAKWATSSGGAASINNYPLPQDTVIFDSASGGGNVTLPASIRFKNLNVQIAPSTTTAIYSTATNISNIITNMFMSGSFTGPLALGGPFIFGNDSAYNFNYSSSTIKSQMNLIVADSSVSDTHTIAAQNVQFMPKGGLLFAILGTLQITEDIKNTSGYELAQIDAYSDSNGLINFTCSNVGRNLSSTDWTSTSSNYNFAGGNFNLGGCVFGAANIYTSGGTSIANTPYTVIASNFVAMTNPITSNAGNVVAIFNTGGAPNGVTISVVNNPTYKNISTVGASSTSFIYFSGTSTFNCYNFSVDGPLSLRSLNANKSIVKVGGGKISLSGVKVTASGFRLNASPANTWYVPSGTVGSGSTGWTIASVATDAGGFIFF